MKTKNLLKMAAMGVILTPILAIYATPKAMKVIDNERKKRDMSEIPADFINLTITDKIKASWKCYIPTITTGLLTISYINKLATTTYTDKVIIIVDGDKQSTITQF